MQRRPGLLPALLVALAVTLAGCGAAPPKLGPTGVDQLEIPTPSPDPRDFVSGIDNPLLPYRPGNTWEYAVSGDPVVVRRAVAVLDEERVIAGVSTTEVLETETDEDDVVVTERRTWVAQDEAGNVWRLGGEVVDYAAGSVVGRDSWEAARDGAQAGVVMLANPRVGDGYLTAYAEGLVEDRTRIVALDEEVTVPLGRFSSVLETERTSPLRPDVTVRDFHAEGVGLVRETVLEDGRTAELVLFGEADQD